MFNPNNTSQDPEFEGPTGHERRIHKTHWTMKQSLKLKTKGESDTEWVRIGPGRYKLVRKRNDASAEAER